MNFRDLVQKLTAGPEFVQARRLQSVAPPPLEVVAANAAAQQQRQPRTMLDSRSTLAAPVQLLHPLPAKPAPALSAMYKEFSDTLEMRTQKVASDGSSATTFLGLNLSPSSYNWCSIPLLSPGTLSSLEHSTVL